MKPITLRVSVTRLEAINAGMRVYGETEIEIDPSVLSPQGRAQLAAVDVASSNLIPTVPITLPVSVGGMCQWLEERARLVAKKKEADAQDLHERVLLALSAPADQWVMTSPSLRYVVNDAGDFAHSGRPIGKPTFVLNDVMCRFGFGDLSPEDKEAMRARADEITDLLPPLQAKWQEKYDAWQAWQAEDRRRTAAEAVAKENAIPDALNAWLAEHGTEGERKLRARGLLPDEDVIEKVTDWVFEPTSLLIEFDDDDEAEMRRCTAVGECQLGVHTETNPAERGTEEDILVMDWIESVMPPSTSVDLVTKTWTQFNGDGDEIVKNERNLIMVTTLVRGIQVHRTFWDGDYQLGVIGDLPGPGDVLKAVEDAADDGALGNNLDIDDGEPIVNLGPYIEPIEEHLESLPHAVYTGGPCPIDFSSAPTLVGGGFSGGPIVTMPAPGFVAADTSAKVNADPIMDADVSTEIVPASRITIGEIKELVRNQIRLADHDLKAKIEGVVKEILGQMKAEGHWPFEPQVVRSESIKSYVEGLLTKQAQATSSESVENPAVAAAEAVAGVIADIGDIADKQRHQIDTATLARFRAYLDSLPTKQDQPIQPAQPDVKG